jgi:phosphotriesterase-related protein
VMVDFVGADLMAPGRYQPDEVFTAALPHLKSAMARGCRTLVECTPDYLGRDPRLMRRLSEATGLHILTNTGYYAAAGHKYVPAHAYKETAGEIAERWIREFRNGIDGSGIKPGFIKIGVEKSPLAEIDRKLVRAAAITHRHTGLTVASHTSDGMGALEQLDIFKDEGVSAQAFIWVHAQSESQADLHLQAAQRGAWVEFDGITESSAVRHAELVAAMIERGYLRQTLVSMDAGWYHVGEAGGGNYRGYDSVFVDFLPALRKRGTGEKAIQDLLVDNPSRALQPRIRSL